MKEVQEIVGFICGVKVMEVEGGICKALGGDIALGAQCHTVKRICSHIAVLIQ